MRLAAKLILLFVVSVIAVTALASMFTDRQFLRNVEKQHRAIATSIQSASGTAEFQSAITTGNSEFEKIARNALTDTTRVRWVWLNETDVPMHFQPTLQDTHVIPDEFKTPFSMTANSNRGVPKFFSYYPQRVGDRLGAIEISSPLTTIRSQSELTWTTAVYSVLALGLLSIGLVMILGVRWIARPLEKLSEKMNRVGQGDFASDLEIQSNDELGELAVAVNQMCDRLREQQQTIQSETHQRIAALEQLRHADRLKTVGQLAAGFAHEVGTPLNVISGRAEMMLAQNPLDTEKVAKHARAIKDESHRISKIIQKLLEFSRQSPSQKVVGDLRDVVSRSVEMIGPLAEKRRIQLNSDLPSQKASATFDFNQFQQVLMNLIDNAIDASQEGQSVDIVLKLRRQENRWAIQILDHGTGISAENRNEIFQPFFTTKEVGSGTGLGLSIVHGIVEDHGGEIRCDSEIDLGTTITIELPAIQCDADEDVET